MDEYVLKTYYVQYLKVIRKVSDSSVQHYQDALRYISKYLVQKKMLQKSIYEIQDIDKLDDIRTFLYSDVDFMTLDKRGHQMYSAGFNNYYRFACGEGFTGIHQKIALLDTESPVAEKQTNLQTTWKRSSIIKIQSIKAADYLCEVDSGHQTFTAKTTGYQYMEGHHILPLRMQDKFDKSHDVYANLICVCPICHRLLHYGVENEKDIILDKIYYDRSERLAASGIKIAKDEFKKFVI